MEADVGGWVAIGGAIVTAVGAALTGFHKYVVKPIGEFLAPLVRSWFESQGKMHNSIADAAPRIIEAVKEGTSESKLMLTSLIQSAETSATQQGRVEAAITGVDSKVTEHHTELRDLRHEYRNHVQAIEGRIAVVEDHVGIKNALSDVKPLSSTNRPSDRK